MKIIIILLLSVILTNQVTAENIILTNTTIEKIYINNVDNCNYSIYGSSFVLSCCPSYVYVEEDNFRFYISIFAFLIIYIIFLIITIIQKMY